MKHISVPIELAEKLVETEVELSPDGSDRAQAVEKMRQLIWQIMLRPMQEAPSATVDFLYDFVKCKDTIDPAVKDPSITLVSLDDQQFQTLHHTFQEFKNWNVGIARVILTVSSCLGEAMIGKTQPVQPPVETERKA